MSLQARGWYRSNTFSHEAYPLGRLLGAGLGSVSVCLPARNEARTIGAIIQKLEPLRESGLVEQVVVIDGSTDETAEIARTLGAEVYHQDELLSEHGPAHGKGDAMWRALSVLTGEIICYLDADSGGFGPHFVAGLLGPLAFEPGVQFVKGYYRRPFRVGEMTLPNDGGRVTELTARPLLNMFYPDLAGVEQPLSGELCARRELLERLPFTTGYGVDIGLLIDTYRAVGLDALAQVDLDVRQNDHQSLAQLGLMAYAVLHSVASRLEREGRMEGPLPTSLLARQGGGLQTLDGEPIERPPLGDLRAVA